MSKGGSSSENVKKLHDEVHEVTGLLQKNVESAIQRGQKLDDIEDRAEQLNLSSREFSDKAVRLKRKMWWQNTKMMIIIGVTVVLILTIIIVLSTQPWKK